MMLTFKASEWLVDSRRSGVLLVLAAVLCASHGAPAGADVTAGGDRLLSQLSRQLADHERQLFTGEASQPAKTIEDVRFRLKVCYAEVFGRSAPPPPAAGEATSSWLLTISDEIGGELWGENAWADRVLKL